MICNATVSDAAALWAVRRAAIQGISTEHYSKAQLNAWRDERTVHSYVPPIREKVLLVAEFQGKVIGYAQLDPKLHVVQALYVHPQYSGNGIGIALLQDLESQAQSLGILELHLESSLNAVGFYVKAGYRQKATFPPASESIHMARRLAAR